MANVAQILERTKALQRKYEKYMDSDQPKASKAAPAKPGSKFDEEYGRLNEVFSDLSTDAAAVSNLRDRSQIALKNAEIRKRKQELISDLAQLKTSVRKSRIADDLKQYQLGLVEELESSVDGVADGLNVARKKPGATEGHRRGFSLGGGGGPSKPYVNIELGDMPNGSDYYKDTDENRAFRQEFNTRKVKQDQALDDIEKGLGTLANIATDMGSELKKQETLLDEVEREMDKATTSVETNNKKLAGVLRRVQNERSYCVTLILLVVLLAVAGYIYTLVS